MKVEYKVRPVTRYVVTRWFEDNGSSGVETRGEFDNHELAHTVAYSLCSVEHDQLGYPVGDERIQYPTND